jgi:hypothetical protein
MSWWFNFISFCQIHIYAKHPLIMYRINNLWTWIIITIMFIIIINHIGGVMARVLASSVVDRGYEPLSGEAKDYKLVVVASLLSTQH